LYKYDKSQPRAPFNDCFKLITDVHPHSVKQRNSIIFMTESTFWLTSESVEV